MSYVHFNFSSRDSTHIMLVEVTPFSLCLYHIEFTKPLYKQHSFKALDVNKVDFDQCHS